MNNYEQKIRDIIVEQLGVAPEKVTPEASFIDDLGADSEEAFEVEIPDEDAEKMEKVGDAINYLRTRLGASN